MNWEMVKGLVERIAYMLVLWGITLGYIPEETAKEVVASVMTFAGLVWGWWVNRGINLVKTTSALPGVNRIVVSTASRMADSSAAGAKITNS